MNNNNPVRIYTTHELTTYDAVYFEELNRWHIRCNTADGLQTWSVTGYDSPREAMLGFDGRVTYIEKPPGMSA